MAHQLSTIYIFWGLQTRINWEMVDFAVICHRWAMNRDCRIHWIPRRWPVHGPRRRPMMMKTRTSDWVAAANRFASSACQCANGNWVHWPGDCCYRSGCCYSPPPSLPSLHNHIRRGCDCRTSGIDRQCRIGDCTGCTGNIRLQTAQRLAHDSGRQQTGHYLRWYTRPPCTRMTISKAGISLLHAEHMPVVPNNLQRQISQSVSWLVGGDTRANKRAKLTSDNLVYTEWD